MREPGSAEAAGRQIADFKPERRHVEQVMWPGTERPVHVLYLSVQEVQDAYFAARAYFDSKVQKVDGFGEVQLDREIEYQMVRLMLLQSEDPKVKLFGRTDDVRLALSVNEVQHFMSEQERMKIEEWTSWHAELDHVTLRQIARVLDLPMTTTPEALADAVQALRESAEQAAAALME